MSGLLLQVTGTLEGFIPRGARAAFQRAAAVVAKLILMAAQMKRVFLADEAVLRELGDRQTEVPYLKSMPRGGS